MFIMANNEKFKNMFEREKQKIDELVTKRDQLFIERDNISSTGSEKREKIRTINAEIKTLNHELSEIGRELVEKNTSLPEELKKLTKIKGKKVLVNYEINGEKLTAHVVSNSRGKFNNIASEINLNNQSDEEPEEERTKGRNIKLFGKKIERITLYGSYARGDFNLESDVDIMILLNCDQKEIMQRRKEISRIASRIGLKNDIMVKIFVAFEGVQTVSKGRRKLINKFIFSTSEKKPWEQFVDMLYKIYDSEKLKTIYMWEMD